MPTADGDTTINYLENANDSIDFSRGGVKIRITAADAETKREYDVKVNVHNITADSLYWSQSAKRQIPTALQSPQRTENGGIRQLGDMLYRQRQQ